MRASDAIFSHYDAICECGHKRIDHWKYQTDSVPKKEIIRCEGCYKNESHYMRWSSMERSFGQYKSNHEFSEDFSSLVERMRKENE